MAEEIEHILIFIKSLQRQSPDISDNEPIDDEIKKVILIIKK